MSKLKHNWTQAPDGRSNASDEFEDLVREVEMLIRSSSSELIAGRADSVARFIMAQLAHVHGLAPER